MRISLDDEDSSAAGATGGAATDPPNDLPKAPNKPAGTPPIRIAGFVSGGVGVVLTGVGIGVAVSGIGKTNDAADAYSKANAKADNQAAAQARADHDAGNAQTAAGWVVTGIGGAALVAGIVMVALPSHSKTTATVWTIAPFADGGASLRGVF